MIYRKNGIIFDIVAAQAVADADGAISHYARGDLLKNQDKWADLGITQEADPPVPPQTPAEIATALTQKIADTIRRIDVDVDNIYRDAVGNRLSEYQLAESEAAAFKTAGYAGTVPPTTQSWATLNSLSATWAADNILAQSALWKAAQLAIRNARLATKATVRKAIDVTALDAAVVTWSATVTILRNQLGI